MPKMIEQLRELPELTDVAADLQHRGQELYLEIDRDAAARLGVSVSTVAQVLQNAFGQRQISTLFTQSNQYRVVLEMDPALAAGPDALRSIHVPAPGGQIPLASLARLHQRGTPSSRFGSSCSCRRLSRSASRARRRPSRRHWPTACG